MLPTFSLPFAPFLSSFSLSVTYPSLQIPCTKGHAPNPGHHPSCLFFFVPVYFPFLFLLLPCLSWSWELDIKEWHWERKMREGSKKQDKGLKTWYGWRIFLFKRCLLNMDQVVVVHCPTFDGIWGHSHDCRVVGGEKLNRAGWELSQTQNGKTVISQKYCLSNTGHETLGCSIEPSLKMEKSTDA